MLTGPSNRTVWPGSNIAPSPHWAVANQQLLLRSGPVNYGPTAEAATPWLALALYTAMQAGPPSIMLVCGQRIWRLPPQLAGCTHALLWPWDQTAVRAQVLPCPPAARSSMRSPWASRARSAGVKQQCLLNT